jgi:hypothetical protein
MLLASTLVASCAPKNGSATQPAQTASTANWTADDWVGTWTGMWDNTWKARFTISPAVGGKHKVLYEWQEDRENPKMSSETTQGYVSQQGNKFMCVERGMVISFSRILNPPSVIVDGGFGGVKRHGEFQKSAGSSAAAPPPASKPRAPSAWEGTWIGKWDDIWETELKIRRVAASGRSYSIDYSWQRQPPKPERVRETLTATEESSNKLVCFGKGLKIEIVRSASGVVSAKTFFQGRSGRTKLKKQRS